MWNTIPTIGVAVEEIVKAAISGPASRMNGIVIEETMLPNGRTVADITSTGSGPAFVNHVVKSGARPPHDPPSKVKSQLGSRLERESESESDFDLDRESESEIESEIDLDNESESEFDLEIDNEIESDSEFDREIDTEIDVEIESDFDLERESESDFEIESDTSGGVQSSFNDSNSTRRARVAQTSCSSISRRS